MNSNLFSGGLTLGVGIDLVDMPELKAMDARTKGVFSRKVFHPSEHREAKIDVTAEFAPYSDLTYEYLAGRFAVKEAVFKALAHLTPYHTFDFRIIECNSNRDGSPFVVHNEATARVLADAGADDVLVSISNEGPFSVAIAVAIRKLPE